MSSIGGSTGYGRRAVLAKCLAGIALFRSGVAKAQGAEIRLLMLGDSITAGYGLARSEGPPARLQALLQAKGRHVRVIDAGVSGDTSAGGRARLDWALADRPQAVIVALGGNDALRGLTPQQMRTNLAAILDRLAQRNIPALLAGMIAPPNLGRDYGDEFRAVFTDLARERPEVVFYPFLLDGVAGDPRLNQPDRIHPTAEGAEEIARRMLPFVETLLDRVRLPAAG
jgi:acyl-CoA thioesterase-1